MIKYLAYFSLAIILIVMNSFVFMKGWEWIVVPMFGIPSLKLVETIGLLTLFSFIQAKDFSKENERSIGEMFIVKVIYLLLIFFILWLISFGI